MKDLNIVESLLCGAAVRTIEGTILGVIFAPGNGINTRLSFLKPQRGIAIYQKKGVMELLK